MTADVQKQQLLNPVVMEHTLKKTIAWQVDGTGVPRLLEPGRLDLEKRLEDWVEKDPSIISDDVLIIGRQVPTMYGTIIDLLGIDTRGDLVIIELKRSQTLRDTVAQGLEYAAWTSKLGFNEIIQFGAQKYGGEEVFRQAFEDRFGLPLPETVNASQRVILVAPEISDATAAVITYLSEAYGVPINGVSFDLVALDDKQVIIRQQVVSEDSHTSKSPGSKQQPSRTREQFIQQAAQNQVGEAFEHLLTLENELPSMKFFVNGMRFSEKSLDNKTLTVLNVFPTKETYKRLLAVYIPPQNLERIYGRSLTLCEAFVQELQVIGKPIPSWGGWPGVGLASAEQTEQFVNRFRRFLSKSCEASTAHTALASSDG